MQQQELFDFIRAHRFCVLSTVSRDSTPESAVIGFAVTPDLEIVFDTVKSSRKYANLSQNHAVSMVFWTGEKTVQFEGVATEPEGAERDRYRDVYFVTFPDGRERLSWPGITHFVVRPKWIRYSDFGARPPRIEELRF